MNSLFELGDKVEFEGKPYVVKKVYLGDICSKDPYIYGIEDLTYDSCESLLSVREGLLRVLSDQSSGESTSN